MSQLVREVTRIAKAAGVAILEVYRREDQGVSLKADKSPVTEADRKADAIIIDGLKQLSETFPILTEESSECGYEERRDWETFWLVDPLDGTKEFLKGTGQFTVNIALIQAGKPILGVVWAPVIERLYWAAKGSGAHRVLEGKEERISTRVARPESMEIVASQDHSGPQVTALRNQYPGCGLKSMGSSLKLCLVAEGSADLYLRDGPTMEWDTGAAHSVVTEAGGTVKEWLGTQAGTGLAYNKENLLNPAFLVQGDAGLNVVLRETA